eukprot:m51a1_g3080 hypothetical protein (205) ;mRNA; f:54671-55572
MSDLDKVKPLVTPIILLVYWVMQVAALGVIDWASAKDVSDFCDSYSGWWCHVLRGSQASEAFGILAVLVGSFVLIATILAAIQALHSLGEGLRVLCSPMARWLFVGCCALVVLFSLLACIIWPGTYNDGKPKGVDDFGEHGDSKDWLALQIVALLLAAAATVTAFLCSATDSAASSSPSSSGSKPAEAPAPAQPAETPAQQPQP